MGAIEARVFENPDGVADAAAKLFRDIVVESVADHGSCAIALAGGSTPRLLYRKLASQGEIAWGKCQLFLGDERLVPADDDRSNQAMVQAELLDQVPEAAASFHPIPVELDDSESVACQYERAVLDTVRRDATGMPRFDLILLGMGSDAHTASLFPGKPALDERSSLVVTSPPGVLPPPVDRITFTLPMINAARNVLFLVAGPDKTEAYARVTYELTRPAEQASAPAARVRAEDGLVLWLLDSAATAGVGATTS